MRLAVYGESLLFTLPVVGVDEDDDALLYHNYNELKSCQLHAHKVAIRLSKPFWLGRLNGGSFFAARVVMIFAAVVVDGRSGKTLWQNDRENLIERREKEEEEDHKLESIMHTRTQPFCLQLHRCFQEIRRVKSDSGKKNFLM